MLCIAPPHTEPPEELTRAALLAPRKWRTRLLRVRFLDGDSAVWQRVAALVTGAEGWNSASGLQFWFNQAADAEIRIAFEPGASWSYEGHYDPGPDKPTMNFGWLNRDTPHQEMRRVVLHEFGHALGLVHEHTVPWSQIPWDREAVYAWFGRQGWDRVRVDGQVLGAVAREVLSSGGYDGRSIMHYHIPAELLLDRKARGGATELSAEDRRMVARWYGRPPVEWWRG